MSISKGWLFSKVGKTRIIPLYIKIVIIFLLLILISNLTTNFINLSMNRSEILRLAGELLTKELKELYIFASNQYQIYVFDGDSEASQEALQVAATTNLRLPYATSFGISPEAKILFLAVNDASEDLKFDDLSFIEEWNRKRESGQEDGEAKFRLGSRSYFGFYKYHPNWDVYLVRAEDEVTFYSESWGIFIRVGIIILLLTVAIAWLGIVLLRRIFKFVDVITQALFEMQRTQELRIIELEKAPNDDITYLGMSFNALSTTIKNLMNIFKKFVTKDVVQQAYRQRYVSLEGTQKELTILFSDIKGFTFMTETLGTDIINLLNLHYDRAIRLIQQSDGIIGSIIGDALLAVFGTLEGTEKYRSLSALRAAFHIQRVAAQLREAMAKKKEDLLARKGELTPQEEAVFKAVLLEIGVGLDCGKVFYGRIGSYVHMTNTVIGDNVNSSSRLEGLTRVYKVPIIISEQVRNEILALQNDDYFFQELDTVQVKGKTTGKKVYWPIERAALTEELENDLAVFQEALGLYYTGDWVQAKKIFAKVNSPISQVFEERIKSAKNPPLGWNGIWTMTTK